MTVPFKTLAPSVVKIPEITYVSSLVTDVNAGDDQTPCNSGFTTLTGSCVPPECDFTWSQVSGPSQATFVDDHSITTSVSGAFGSYVFRLTAVNEFGSAYNDVSINLTSCPLTEVDALIISGGAGGGGGGAPNMNPSRSGGGGGGGAGTYVIGTDMPVYAGLNKVWVGTVGGGGQYQGAKGHISGFGITYTPWAGGGGGQGVYNDTGTDGLPGSSGGGGGGSEVTLRTGGASEESPGNIGGNSAPASALGQASAGGGGGSAGAIGGNGATGVRAGNGGQGVLNPYYIGTAQSAYICSGGGGAYTGVTSPQGGFGGTGAGRGAYWTGSGAVTDPTNATGFGSGGGGGGGFYTGVSHNGSNGGTGAVIIKYEGNVSATGGTIYSLNGFTYHEFSANGSFIIPGRDATNSPISAGIPCETVSTPGDTCAKSGFIRAYPITDNGATVTYRMQFVGASVVDGIRGRYQNDSDGIPHVVTTDAPFNVTYPAGSQTSAGMEAYCSSAWQNMTNYYTAWWWYFA